MKFKYTVRDSIFDPKSMLDETNFYHQGQGKPAELTKKLTHVMGSYSGKYPISMMTMGNVVEGGQYTSSSRSAKELDDVQFTYPVMGKDDKASIVTDIEYSGTDKPGIGYSEFYITFSDNWIKRYYIIESRSGVQAYVLEDGVATSKGFRYKVQLDAVGPKASCPLSELQPGTLWVDLYAAVAESESRGTESKMAVPGKRKNQMGFIRASYHFSGNVANKMINIDVESPNGKKVTTWMDLAMWQFEHRWLNECEHVYWYSRYNRQADGNIPLKDLLTGKVIPRGSGLLEQIQNKSTFSDLSYSDLTNKIGDALFGRGDTDKNVNITLHTGRGGMRDFHQAVMKAGGEMIGGSLGDIADKFITGSGRELTLGGFFNSFYTIDGYFVKVKHNPIFDSGRIALKSPIHPDTGFPLESHRMVFIDDNDIDGQPNIQHVSQKGRSYIDGVVPGLTPLPKSLTIGSSGTLDSGQMKVLATDKDVASYHRFKSAGIQMLDGGRSFDLQCVKGL